MAVVPAADSARDEPRRGGRAETREAAAGGPPRLEVPGALPRTVLRPLSVGDDAELRRIHSTPEVLRWWDVPDERFPWDEPESTRLTIEVDGAVAGLIQYGEETEPKYRHATIDLFLDPPCTVAGSGRRYCDAWCDI